MVAGLSQRLLSVRLAVTITVSSSDVEACVGEVAAKAAPDMHNVRAERINGLWLFRGNIREPLLNVNDHHYHSRLYIKLFPFVQDERCRTNMSFDLSQFRAVIKCINVI